MLRGPDGLKYVFRLAELQEIKPYLAKTARVGEMIAEDEMTSSDAAPKRRAACVVTSPMCILLSIDIKAFERLSQEWQAKQAAFLAEFLYNHLPKVKLNYTENKIR